MPELESLNSNQAGSEVKTTYTSKEVLELGIPHKEPPPSPETCKYCGNPLYYEGIFFMNCIALWRRSEPQRCSCEKAVAYWKRHDAEEAQKQQEEEAAERDRQFNDKIRRLLKNSGIKKRFATRTFDTFIVNKKNKKAYAAALKYAEEFEINFSEGKGINFEGTYGTGKTHLAVAIALELMKKGKPVICKTSIDLLADIKKTYDRDSSYDEHQVMKVYKDVSLLIIDDLGKEQCTDWSMPIIYSILNDRYEEMKPTIITTNYNEDMLIQRLTPKGGDSSNIEAIISRLRETNTVITMVWDDYRSEN